MPAASDEQLETYSAGGDTLDTLDAVRDRIIELAELLVDEDDDVETRRRTQRVTATGFPTRASGTSTVGGATNLQHDFITGEDGHGELIPQHSDPVGEIVVREAVAVADELGAARRRAFRHACASMRELEAARSALAATRPSTVKLDPTDRSVCWSCRNRGVHNELVYRDSDVNGKGVFEPRCRSCYDWALSHEGVDPPELVVQTWADGKRLTSKIVDLAERREQERTARKSKNKRKKGKGRR